MTIVFMNLDNSKSSDVHRLSLNLIEKMDLQIGDKHVALSELSVYYTWKNIKKVIQKIISLKYQKQHGMKNLNLLMDLILYQTFRTILIVSSRGIKQ